MGFNSLFKGLKLCDRGRSKHKLAAVFIQYAVCRHTSVSIFVVRRVLVQMKRAKLSCRATEYVDYHVGLVFLSSSKLPDDGAETCSSLTFFMNFILLKL